MAILAIGFHISWAETAHQRDSLAARQVSAVSALRWQVGEEKQVVVGFDAVWNAEEGNKDQ